MTEKEIMDKFTENSVDVLSRDEQQELADNILSLESLSNTADIVTLTCGK